MTRTANAALVLFAVLCLSGVEAAAQDRHHRLALTAGATFARINADGGAFDRKTGTLFGANYTFALHHVVDLRLAVQHSERGVTFEDFAGIFDVDTGHLDFAVAARATFRGRTGWMAAQVGPWTSFNTTCSMSVHLGSVIIADRTDCGPQRLNYPFGPDLEYGGLTPATEFGVHAGAGAALTVHRRLTFEAEGLWYRGLTAAYSNVEADGDSTGPTGRTNMFTAQLSFTLHLRR